MITAAKIFSTAHFCFSNPMKTLGAGIFLLLCLHIPAQNASAGVEPLSVGCSISGLTSVSQYATGTYTLNGSLCGSAATWSISCGSIMVGTTTSTSAEFYFNGSCTSTTITAYNSSQAEIAHVTISVTPAPPLNGGAITNPSQTINYNTQPALLSTTSASSGSCAGGGGVDVASASSLRVAAASTTSSSGYSYLWYSSADGSNFYSTGVTDQDYQPGYLTSKTYFRREVTCGEQTAYTNIATVDVYSELVPGTLYPTTEIDPINYGGIAPLLSISGTSGGNGSYSYQWMYSDSPNGTYYNVPANTNANTDGTGTTYQPVPLYGTTYFKVQVTSNGAAASTPNPLVIIVYQIVGGGNISPASVNINNNTSTGAFTSSGVSGGNGNYSYQWQLSTDKTNWNDIANENNSTYQGQVLTTVNSSTTYYYFRVRVTSNGATAYSSISTVTVYAPLQPGFIDQPQQTILNGNSADNLVVEGTSGGNGRYTYQWQFSYDNSNWSDISNGTQVSYGPIDLSTNTYYRARVSSNGISLYATQAVVWVLTTGGISPSNMNINYNTSPGTLTLSGVSGSNGMYKYQWLSSSTSDFSNATVISGANGTTYTPGPLTSPTYFAVAVTSNELTSNSAIAYVNIYPQGSISPASTTTDVGMSPGVFSVSAVGGNGSYTYQWQSYTDLSPTPVDIAGATTTTYSAPPQNITTYYQVKITSNGLSATTPRATANATLAIATITPESQLVPSNTTPAPLQDYNVMGGNSIYNYQWNMSTDGASWSAIPGASGSVTGPLVDPGALISYSPSLVAVTTYYTLTVISNGISSTTPPVVINVFPSLEPGTITPTSIFVDAGSSPGQFNVSAPQQGDCNGTYGYQWLSSSDGVDYDYIGVTTENYAPQGLSTRTWFKREVTCGTQVLYTNAVEVQVSTLTQGTGVNYIRTHTIKNAGSTSLPSANGLTDPNLVQISTQYFDGLGRPFQTVGRQASPLGNDMVSLQVYDDYGRESMHHLPYTSTETGGDVKINSFTSQTSFYGNTSKVASDNAPYTQTIFETSPLNRVLKQGAAGATWQPDPDVTNMTDYAVKKNYLFNQASDNILLFTYDPNTGLVTATADGTTPRYYADHQLAITKTIDEHQNEVIEYVDKDGHTILKKVQYMTDSGNAKQYANTYYVYDDDGNLAVVLPPEAINSALGSWTHN